MAQKANNATVKLEPAEWWEIKARFEEAEKLEAIAAMAVQNARAARQRVSACLEALAKTHGFDTSGDCRLDEATLSLVPTALPESRT